MLDHTNSEYLNLHLWWLPSLSVTLTSFELLLNLCCRSSAKIRLIIICFTILCTILIIVIEGDRISYALLINYRDVLQLLWSTSRSNIIFWLVSLIKYG